MLFATVAILCKFVSGMGMGVVFGSMVQNGKFFACANDFCAIALNSVLLPTLGSPTNPENYHAFGQEQSFI